MSRHDPLCPQQPRDDGTTLTMLDGNPILCQCDLIAEVRKDENKKVRHLRERIDRLVDKANRWRDEAAELRKQLKEKP